MHLRDCHAVGSQAHNGVAGQRGTASLFALARRRSTSAGASHDFASGCRETRIRFSLGYPVNNTVRGQIRALAENWTDPSQLEATAVKET